jgi:hypothetical protein
MIGNISPNSSPAAENTLNTLKVCGSGEVVKEDLINNIRSMQMDNLDQLSR